MIMSKDTTEAAPSSDIALCLSGGGYRAAAYHLGTLTMLHELGMLDRVKYLSTASGGTIVAMKFVLSRSDNERFEDFSAGFQKFMLENNVVKKALADITKMRFPTQKNDMSLIRAAAGIYEENLTHKKTIKDLKEGAIETNKFVDLIFNVTEFRSGLGFRFRVSNNNRLVFGNNSYNITDRSIQDSIRLSDVVASSSCFPGAFEPMRFPDDFHIPDSERSKLPFGKNANGCRSLPLMDGGIFDNQGVSGLMSTYEDREEKDDLPVIPFEFVLISDTTQKADILLEHKISERSTGVSVNAAFQGSVLFLSAIFFCSLSLFGFAMANFQSVPIFQFVATEIVALFSIAVSGTSLISLAYLRYILRSPEILGCQFPIWKLLQDLKIADIRSLFSTRLSSARVLLFNIFMKRIRDLNMKTVINATNKTTRRNLLFGKNCFSLIYDIEANAEIEKLKKYDPDISVNTRMVRVSKAAGRVPTVLWLNEDQIKILVECGRITTCHSLMRLVWEKWRKDNKDAKELDENAAEEPKPSDPNSKFHEEYHVYKTKWLALGQEKLPDILIA